MLTSKPRRIVLDLSDLFDFLSRRTSTAGIQRLLFSVASRIDQANEGPVELGYWDPIVGDYLKFPVRKFDDDYEALAAKLRFPRIAKVANHKFEKRPLARAWYRSRRNLHRTYSIHIAGLAHKARMARMTEPLRFAEGDILLSLGSGWNDGVGTMLSHVRPMIMEGKVTPIFLVHDLIPFHDGVEPKANAKRGSFTKWFEEAAALGDRFLVYSISTEQDLASRLAQFGRTDALIERFSLAHELPNTARRALAPSPSQEVLRLENERYVLAVGSALGRKNGQRLIQAWEGLGLTIGVESLPKLVFAGSSRRKDLSLPENPALAEKIVFVRSPDEASLAHLYRHAYFCAFPSLFEGWGLPIGEALAHRKLCVTSNTSSMPEVAGPYADYFDPYDVDSMIEALRRPLIEPDYLTSREEKIKCVPLRSWDASTLELTNAVARLVQC